jgi:hypothetical protein
LAAEYEYSHRDIKGTLRAIHSIREKLYASLEQFVFDLPIKKNNIHIEAVSHALKEYLIKKFQAPTQTITIAYHDLPPKISPELLVRWRLEKRRKLQIPDTAYVYVYCGSAKTWQMPEAMMQFFSEKMHDPNRLFLLLTQDADLFKALAQKYMIPETQIRILTVDHTIIYQYLAAADAGLLFRENHLLNWISRPTKVLEYQAVGLVIMHNNTVAWLKNSTNHCNKNTN